jgi:hypothetical protein
VPGAQEVSLERLVTTILIIVGLINLFPVIGIASAKVLTGLYGLESLEGDLLILMRHRALLFGILGTFIIYSASKSHLRPTAIVMGLVSMLGFSVLVFTSGEGAANLSNVAIIDVVASAALVVVAIILLRRRNGT